MKLITSIEIEKEENFLFNTVKNTLRLAKNKINTVEVCIRKTIGINTNVRNGSVENIEFNSDGALFITVYNQFSKGTVSSKDFTLSNIEKMLDKAIHISKYTSSDFFSGLPDIELLYSNKLDLNLFFPLVYNLKKIFKIITISEKTALEYDNRIVNSEGSVFNSHVNIIVFGNSLGMLETYKSTFHSISTCVIARDNFSMYRDFDYSISRNVDNLIDSELLGKKTAIRALSRLGSRKINTVRAPVIFSSEIAYSLFSHLVYSISGINVDQKSTFLINDLNKRIFPEWLNIKENPHLLQGMGSKPFDSEGVKTYSKNIVEAGVLKTWLLNSYFARKLKQVSTGNSGGIYNWLVSYQEIVFSELLQKMHTGLLITELMGQGVDVINGNYSRGVVGFWVENGNITYPVHEITVSGNLRDMWINILSISNDIDMRNKIQSGSVLISEMQISGN